jgi:hypothetical protein
MGGGYYLVTYREEAGLDVENEYLFTEIHAAYDGGRQVNDGVQPNPKGHDRYLAAAAYFLPPWLFSGRTLAGFGWRWNELSTAKYTKRADRPQFGIGYDYLHTPCTACSRDFSMRILVNWITSGSDWRNGVHGPEISLSLPSPREKGHWSFQGRLGVYRFHQTVTDRGNVPMTRSQRADRDFFSVSELGIKLPFLEFVLADV